MFIQANRVNLIGDDFAVHRPYSSFSLKVGYSANRPLTPTLSPGGGEGEEKLVV